MPLEKYNRDVLVAVGVLVALALVYTIVQTWSWAQRAGRLAIDFVTLLKFILFACGNVASAMFIVIFGTSMWWLIFFKVCMSQLLISLDVWFIFPLFPAVCFSFLCMLLFFLFLAEAMLRNKDTLLYTFLLYIYPHCSFLLLAAGLVTFCLNAPPPS